MKGLAVCVLVILTMSQHMVEPAQAFTCAEIAPSLVGCVSFLTGADAKPAAACCDGVKKVKGLCVSTDDKKLACSCIKQAASVIHGIKDGAVSSLPSACNQPLPFHHLRLQLNRLVLIDPEENKGITSC